MSTRNLCDLRDFSRARVAVAALLLGHGQCHHLLTVRWAVCLAGAASDPRASGAGDPDRASEVPG